MKLLRYLLLGIFFGIVLSKAEVISWYRIYEMFHFRSFHMYGVMGSAVLVGMSLVQLIKKTGIRDLKGEEIRFPAKERSYYRYIIGGSLFGMGWAMTGVCPGPMFIQVGHGLGTFVVMTLAAMAGTYTYGILRNRLPH